MPRPAPLLNLADEHLRRSLLWSDQEAYERYIKGEIFNAIKADTNLKNVDSRDFGVFEDLSALTMPKLRAV